MRRSVRDGIVISLPRGGAHEVFRMLAALASRVTVETGKHARDLVGLEGRRVPRNTLLSIALLYPEVTFSKVENARVRALKFSLPSTIPGILKCPNNNCVTVQPKEPVRPGFRLVRKKPLVLQCVYCERYLEDDVARSQIKKGAF